MYYKTISSKKWKLFSYILISFSLAFFLNGCAALDFFDFESPRIVSISPGDMETFPSTNSVSQVSIEFSKEMNQGSVEKAFSLQIIKVDTLDEEAVSGYFSWPSAKKVVFTPTVPFQYGKYKITFASGGEDKKGNNLENDTNTKFLIGTDFMPPEVIYTYPSDNATNLPPTNLVIVVGFSKPIDISSVNSIFSATPSLKYRINAISNNSFFELLPLEKYAANRYSLTIDNVTDLFNNKMRAAKMIRFTIGDDFLPPSLTGIYTNPDFTTAPLLLTNGLNTMDKTNALYFVFSKNMAFDPDNVPVTFSPSISGSWQTNSNFIVFHPGESWDIDKVYSISVNNGFQDASGNSLKETYKSYVKISSPTSVFLKVTGIYCYTNMSYPYQVMDPSLINTITKTDTLTFQLIFDHALQPTTVLQNINVNYVTGEGNQAVSIAQIDFLTTSVLNDTVQVTVISNDLNTYRFIITGGKDGIRDVNNNWMNSGITNFYQLR